jgi:hypothetical protein
MVPLAGIEPALLAESDFESDASTSSAIGATQAVYGINIRHARVGCRARARQRLIAPQAQKNGQIPW